MKAIRVLIADDHPIVRDGIHMLLETQQHIKVSYVAASFEEVRSFLTTPMALQVDIMILDLGGMGDAPISFITKLYRDYPHYRIIVFSSNLGLAPDLIAIGAHGYIVKEEMGQHLLTAIEAVVYGKLYHSPIVADYLDSCASVRKTFQLAPREITVLQYLSEGYSTLEIAKQLFIDARTVQNYITKLRRKLHCHERTQLVQWYKQMYIGSPSIAAHHGINTKGI